MTENEALRAIQNAMIRLDQRLKTLFEIQKGRATLGRQMERVTAQLVLYGDALDAIDGIIKMTREGEK